MPAAGLVLFRVVTLLFLVRMAARFVTRLITSAEEPSSVDMVRDRVCNTFLPRERAVSATIGGRQEHFCSTACRDRAITLLPAP